VPVPLALESYDAGVQFPVWVFTHDKGVVAGLARQGLPGAAGLFIETEKGIEGGTSGSPVVTSTGRLLGVISGGTRTVLIPRIHLAAPVWLVRQMVGLGTRRRVDAALPPGTVKLEGARGRGSVAVRR
jgi:hypothetical protein